MERLSLEMHLDTMPHMRFSTDKIISRIRSVASIPSDAKVLDVGAASGLRVIALKEMGFDAFGVEPWDEARENARRIAGQLGWEVDIREGEAESLPFSEESFHVVIANSVVEHVEDVDLTFSEAYRVLKPGGVFWFFTASSMCPRQGEISKFPLFGWYPNPLKLAIMEWAKKRAPHLIGYTEHPAIHWFTPRKARRLLRNHGFARIYDRWDLRNANPKERNRRTQIISANFLNKCLADVLVKHCSYAAVK
jgi:ubiquinone/menaquinone biosynthesis C-methylase UbiE